VSKRKLKQGRTTKIRWGREKVKMMQGGGEGKNNIGIGTVNDGKER